MAAFESKRYAWRNGYSYKVPAATVGGVLERIEKERGEVTSAAFLDYSRDESAETHELFEWNDTIAAEKFRLRQAGKVINQLEVKLEYVESEPMEIDVEQSDVSKTPRQYITSCAYLNVKKKATGIAASYVNVQRAMSDEESRTQVLENAMQELRYFRQKYRQYKELSEVFKAIENLEKEEVSAEI